jgi:hypothetical protein
MLMTQAQAATRCLDSPGRDAYYGWRYIDGKKCWYKGRSKPSKSVLYWQKKKERPIAPPTLVEKGPKVVEIVGPETDPRWIPLMFATLLYEEAVPPHLNRVTHTEFPVVVVEVRKVSRVKYGPLVIGGSFAIGLLVPMLIGFGAYWRETGNKKAPHDWYPQELVMRRANGVL